jgi:hypothetical protein
MINLAHETKLGCARAAREQTYGIPAFPDCSLTLLGG